MLKSPKKTKFKSPHLYLSTKGLKGTKRTHKSITVRAKESYLFTPQQREITRRILARPLRERYGTLNLRFSRIYL